MVNGVQIELTPEEEQEVLAEWAKNDAEKEAYNYRIMRIQEYPPIEEQLDMQYKDAINGTTVWVDLIRSIKEKYPKPQ